MSGDCAQCGAEDPAEVSAPMGCWVCVADRSRDPAALRRLAHALLQEWWATRLWCHRHGVELD